MCLFVRIFEKRELSENMQQAKISTGCPHMGKGFRGVGMTSMNNKAGF